MEAKGGDEVRRLRGAGPIHRHSVSIPREFIGQWFEDILDLREKVMAAEHLSEKLLRLDKGLVRAVGVSAAVA